jgi:alpha-beta hydrolase superfamily lysophospholipase
MDYFSSLGYETHAISMPGHGKSSLRREHIDKYSFADYVQCFATVVEQMTPCPVVIGHSMGGAIVQSYLKDHSLPGVVLLASIPAEGHLRGFMRIAGAFPLQAMKACWSGYALIETPELAAHHFLAEDTTIDIQYFHRPLVSEPNSTVLRSIYPFSSHPERVTTPVLVLAGGKDTLISMAEQCTTAEILRAKLIIFPGQPHDLMLERGWQDMAASIDDWITCDLNLA